MHNKKVKGKMRGWTGVFDLRSGLTKMLGVWNKELPRQTSRPPSSQDGI